MKGRLAGPSRPIKRPPSLRKRPLNRFSRVKNYALATLLAFTAVACAAGVCFFLTDPPARAAGQELAAARAHAREQASQTRIFPVSPSRYIVSMVPAGLSPAERAQIDSLKLRHRVLLHRRDMAAWFFTRGALFALLTAGFCWFLEKRKPAEAPDSIRFARDPA